MLVLTVMTDHPPRDLLEGQGYVKFKARTNGVEDMVAYCMLQGTIGSTKGGLKLSNIFAHEVGREYSSGRVHSVGEGEGRSWKQQGLDLPIKQGSWDSEWSGLHTMKMKYSVRRRTG